MRTTLLGAVLTAAVSVTVGACTPGGSAMMGNDRVVNVDIDCLNDNGVTGVSFTLSPWRVEVPNRGAIRWVLGKAPRGNKTVIKPANAARWPFQEPSFTTEPGNPNAGGRLKAGVTAGIYKYTVTTICYRDGGVEDTVIVDPDMIIPPSFQ